MYTHVPNRASVCVHKQMCTVGSLYVRTHKVAVCVCVCVCVCVYTGVGILGEGVCVCAYLCVIDGYCVYMRVPSWKLLCV